MSTPETDRTEETIGTWGAPPLKFGAGAADEVGSDMAASESGGSWS
jgi:hydroxyacid-oxoacid transhydrogenase